jgi:ubiquinone/menaquinone biosynthesis C-methylase UbiE
MRDKMNLEVKWNKIAKKGDLTAVIDPNDIKGRKNTYIDILQKLALSKHLDKNPSVTIDLGCGIGRLSNMLSKISDFVVGIEITKEMLNFAIQQVKYPNIGFVLFDGINLPIKNEKVDLVVTISVLQWITNTVKLKKLINEIKRCVKPKGVLLFIEQVTRNKRRFQRHYKEYIQLFEENNLKIISAYPIRKGHCLILYPILLGFVPKSWFIPLAKMEMWIRRHLWSSKWDYEDYLFKLERI